MYSESYTYISYKLTSLNHGDLLDIINTLLSQPNVNSCEYGTTIIAGSRDDGGYHVTCGDIRTDNSPLHVKIPRHNRCSTIHTHPRMGDGRTFSPPSAADYSAAVYGVYDYVVDMERPGVYVLWEYTRHGSGDMCYIDYCIAQDAYNLTRGEHITHVLDLGVRISKPVYVRCYRLVNYDGYVALIAKEVDYVTPDYEDIRNSSMQVCY